MGAYTIHRTAFCSSKGYINANCEILLQSSSSPTFLSLSCQDEKERSSSFLLSGASQQVTTLPDASSPVDKRSGCPECSLQQTILQRLCILGHVGRCVLGKTPRAGWSPRKGTCGPLLLCKRRTETWKGHPGRVSVLHCRLFVCLHCA